MNLQKNIETIKKYESEIKELLEKIKRFDSEAPKDKQQVMKKKSIFIAKKWKIVSKN